MTLHWAFLSCPFRPSSCKPTMAANPTADPKLELFDPLSGKAFRGHHGLHVSHYGVFCVECRMSVASSPSSLQRHLKKHPSWELIISLQDLKNLCSKHIEELKHNQDITISHLRIQDGYKCSCGNLFKEQRYLKNHCRYNGACQSSSATKIKAVVTVCFRFVHVDSSHPSDDWNIHNTETILEGFASPRGGLKTYCQLFHGLCLSHREDFLKKMTEMIGWANQKSQTKTMNLCCVH